MKEMEMKVMRLNPKQEKIVRMLEEKVVSPKELAKALGTGYTEMKAQAMVLTLARAGYVDKGKAAIILHGTEMAKFLKGQPLGSNLKGEIPQPVRR